jgi:hypothetical protein
MVIEGDYQVQVELRTQTGIPADNIINTFAFQWVGSGAPDFETLVLLIDAFYDELGTDVFSNVLAIATDSHQVKIYDLTDPSPRPPVHVGYFSQSGGTNPLPAEVAICASFQGIQEAGHPQARRRGRIFIGPLRQATVATGSDGYPRISTSARTALATACTDLQANASMSDWAWCVWSRSDDELYIVNNGWIEDEFDTQRRRGPGPLTRTTWGAGM